MPVGNEQRLSHVVEIALQDTIPNRGKRRHGWGVPSVPMLAFEQGHGEQKVVLLFRQEVLRILSMNRLWKAFERTRPSREVFLLCCPAEPWCAGAVLVVIIDSVLVGCNQSGASRPGVEPGQQKLCDASAYSKDAGGSWVDLSPLATRSFRYLH